MRISPPKAAPVMKALPGYSLFAAPFAVADALAICVVIVLVRGPMVVPGTVLAASVVTMLMVLPLAIVSIAVASGTTLDGIVVPGIVVVYTSSSPNAVAGIALSLPDAVYWVGSESVAVSGLDGEEGEP